MSKPTQAEIDAATEVVEGYLEQQLADMRNKTIERCAQVAENFEWTKDADNSDLAAAIRALKDK